MFHLPQHKLIKTPIVLCIMTMSLLISSSFTDAKASLECNIIPQSAEFPQTGTGNAMWINGNKEFVFLVAYGIDSAISKASYAYEVYDVTTGKTTLFRDVNTLLPVLRAALPFPNDIDPDPQSAFLIFSSMDKKRVIYPKNGHLWYQNFVTGVKGDLGISYESADMKYKDSLLYDPLTVFWDDKGENAIYQLYSVSPYPNDAVWKIHEANGSVQSQLIEDTPPIKDLMQKGTIFGFYIPGMSPDGRYTIIQPVPGDMALLYDVQSQATTELPFKVEGTQLAWINNHVLLTEADSFPNHDLLVYDIQTQKTTDIISFANGERDLLLSPDGRYGIGIAKEATPNDPGVLEVCKIPWPSEYAASLTPTPTTQPSATATPNSASVPGSNQIGG